MTRPPDQTLDHVEGKFPLGSVGQENLETKKMLGMAHLHNTYSGILYKVISIFDRGLNYPCFLVFR